MAVAVGVASATAPARVVAVEVVEVVATKGRVEEKATKEESSLVIGSAQIAVSIVLRPRLNASSAGHASQLGYHVSLMAMGTVVVAETVMTVAAAETVMTVAAETVMTVETVVTVGTVVAETGVVVAMIGTTVGLVAAMIGTRAVAAAVVIGATVAVAAVTVGVRAVAVGAVIGMTVVDCNCGSASLTSFGLWIARDGTHLARATLLDFW